MSYATLGNGHASPVAIESFARAAGVQMLHVPFKDAGALFTAIASGDVDLAAFSVRTMAGTPPQRLAQLQRDITAVLALPGVRTRAEQAGFEITPSTPQALRERVQADTALYAPLVAEGRVARM